METLAELRRVKVGQEFLLVFSKFPWKNGVQLPVKRKVSRVQTNALAFAPIPENGIDRESWLYFPKANGFRGTEKGFDIIEGNEILLSYEIAHRGKII